ncbi:MAG: RNA polymerase sigma factor [Spirosomataceae bacterium]
MLSEQEIIHGCRSNDRAAQRRLYDLYAGKMHVVCLRYARTTAEAEDILQEAFIKVFEKIGTFRQECPLSVWIKRIVVNTALNHVRTYHRWQDTVDAETVEGEIEDEHSGVSGFHFQELLQLVRELPTGCQTVFSLYAIEGYQHNEIAQLLNISEGTSKSQYSRARMLLQRMLTDKMATK